MATLQEAKTQILGTAGAWNLRTPNIFGQIECRRFQTLIDNPHELNQGNAGCCGFAAVIMFLLAYDQIKKQKVLAPTLCAALLDENQKIFVKSNSGGNPTYSNIRARLIKRLEIDPVWGLSKMNHLDLWLSIGLMIAFKDYLKTCNSSSASRHGIKEFEIDSQGKSTETMRASMPGPAIFQKCKDYSVACTGNDFNKGGVKLKDWNNSASLDKFREQAAEYLKDQHGKALAQAQAQAQALARAVALAQAQASSFSLSEAKDYSLKYGCHRKKGDLALTQEGLVELLYFVWHKLRPTSTTSVNTLDPAPEYTGLVSSATRLWPRLKEFPAKETLWDRLANLASTPGGWIVGVANEKHNEASGARVAAIENYDFISHWVYMPHDGPNKSNPKLTVIWTWGGESNLENINNSHNYVPVWALALGRP